MREWALVIAGAFLLVASVVLIWFGKGNAGEGEASIFGIALKKLGPAVVLAILGLGAIAFAVSGSDPKKDSAAVKGVVTQVPDAPGFPEVHDLNDPVDEAAFTAWLEGVFAADVWVEIQGEAVRTGDYALVIPEEALPDESVDVDELGNLVSGQTSTLIIREVFDEQVVAQLDELAIEAFMNRLPEVPVPGEIYLPAQEGDAVFAVPSEQGAAFGEAQARVSEADEKDLPPAVRQDRQEAALRALRQYRERFPGTLFAPDALFDQAFLLWEMGRSSEAEDAFGLFVSTYPRHPSVDGAREHIETIRSGATQPPVAAQPTS